MSEHIKEAELQLRRLVGVLREKPGMPEEIIQQLLQSSLRLTAHVAELRHLKARLDEVWTAWEHSA